MKSHIKWNFIVVVTLLCYVPIALLADRPRPHKPGTGAVCRLIPADESKATGHVRLYLKDEFVEISGDLQNVPAGAYVLTLNMYGDIADGGAHHVGPVVSVGESDVDLEFKFDVSEDDFDIGSEIYFKVDKLNLTSVIGRSIVIRSKTGKLTALGVVGIPHPPQTKKR